MIPQIIVLCLMFGEIILAAAKHGEDKGEFHVGKSLLSVTIIFLLLYWGGFFNCFGW